VHANRRSLATRDSRLIFRWRSFPPFLARTLRQSSELEGIVNRQRQHPSMRLPTRPATSVKALGARRIENNVACGDQVSGASAPSVACIRGRHHESGCGDGRELRFAAVLEPGDSIKRILLTVSLTEATRLRYARPPCGSPPQSGRTRVLLLAGRRRGGSPEGLARGGNPRKGAVPPRSDLARLTGGCIGGFRTHSHALTVPRNQYARSVLDPRAGSPTPPGELEGCSASIPAMRES
jgi:hypothetical protein